VRHLDCFAKQNAFKLNNYTKPRSFVLQGFCAFSAAAFGCKAFIARPSIHPKTNKKAAAITAAAMRRCKCMQHLLLHNNIFFHNFNTFLNIFTFCLYFYSLLKLTGI
jgi:hypothetical protein